MFYFLSSSFKDTLFFANVFHYISFRAIAALLTALFFGLLCGSWFINSWAQLFRSKVREYTPESHKAKNDMPTMGGIFIITTVFLSALLWADLANPLVWIFLVCLLGFGAIGFWDDWSKIQFGKGISARGKFLAQWGVACLISILLVYVGHVHTTVSFPFFKNFNPDIGLLFIPWAMFILVSFSNAVNLTDGLDGLAIGSLLPNFVLFSLISYLAGHVIIAAYLNIPFAGSAEIAVLGATLIGASLGFLWYNAYPAQIFMGDTGSLALGGLLGTVAVIVKQEILLIIVGGIFVVEALSVILQVASFKMRGKRIFKMAPLHHHFELSGVPESKLIVRFWIVAIILTLLTLSTLKLR